MLVIRSCTPTYVLARLVIRRRRYARYAIDAREAKMLADQLSMKRYEPNVPPHQRPTNQSHLSSVNDTINDYVGDL